MKMPLLISVLFATIFTGCGIRETFDALENNRQAVDTSTYAIQQNIQAIEQANESIRENRRQLEEINKTLKKVGES